MPALIGRLADAYSRYLSDVWPRDRLLAENPYSAGEREHLLYRNKPVLQPHLNIDDLWEMLPDQDRHAHGSRTERNDCGGPCTHARHSAAFMHRNSGTEGPRIEEWLGSGRAGGIVSLDSGHYLERRTHVVVP